MALFDWCAQCRVKFVFHELKVYNRKDSHGWIANIILLRPSLCRALKTVLVFPYRPIIWGHEFKSRQSITYDVDIILEQNNVLNSRYSRVFWQVITLKLLNPHISLFVCWIKVHSEYSWNLFENYLNLTLLL